jgi:alanyl-tRNA synthetase
MQYRLTANGWENLPQKNVDFGGGLERIAMAIQKKQDIFLTDNFYPIIARLEKLSGLKYGQDPHTTKAMRILADHLRAAALLAMDGVIPGNKDQGYVLRRFLRRMVRFGKNKLKLENISESLFPGVIESLGWLYPELSTKQKEIITLFKTEEERFINTLKRAQKQVDEVLNKIKPTTPALAEAAFNLYQSLGYPPEMLVDDLKDRGMKLTFSKFTQAYQKYAAKHQAISRRGADQKFKGGLADHSQKVIKYHTATHVVHQALRIVLKEAIQQQGSNITANRLRFDFSYHQGLSKNQIKQVEKVVNNTIKAKLPVNFQIMDKNEAIKAGALHFSKEKYPDKVKVYYIGPNLEQAFSKEFCAGPHVQNLAELKPLKIYKQKSVGKGVRRIYAKFV